MSIFRRSILAKILAVFFAILFLSLVGITTYDSITTQKRVIKTAKETEKMLSNQIEQSAEVLFASTEMTLQGISREKSIVNILVADKYKSEIYKDFKQYEDGNRFIKSLMMATKDNQIFKSSGDSNTPKSFKEGEIPWFEEAMENRGRVIYTSPTINEKTGVREIILAKTVNKDGNVIGAVAAVISAELIQGLLKEVRMGETGYSFSVDSSGVVTAHHNEEKIALDISEEAFFKEMLDKNDGYIEYEIDGIKKFLYFKNNLRTGWKFAVTMSHKEINDEMRSTIIKNLIILIVTLIIGTYLSRRTVEGVVRPIRRLENAIEQVERDGNLIVRLEVEHEDEVGLLTRSFNNMISRLRDLVNSVSIANTELVNFSSEFSSVCQSNAASVQQISASLEEISDGSTDQHVQANDMLREAMEFSDYINGIEENSKKVSKETRESQELNKNGVSKIKELHEISKNNIEYVGKVGEEIKGLHEKSQAVARITQSIEEIAGKINMISINARIEAAKAGEFGASFSVVAREVQSLADETQKLASSIHSYIDEMVTQVEITSDIMENTKKISHKQFDVMLNTEEVFGSIKKSSDMIAKEVESLDMSIEKMSIKKENILAGVGNITAVTKQSAVLVKEVSVEIEVQSENIEQVSRNSGKLMNMAKGLEDKISVFSTEENPEAHTEAIGNKKGRRRLSNNIGIKLKGFRFKIFNPFKLILKKIDLRQFAFFRYNNIAKKKDFRKSI